mmetsp:Transcript_105842/g.306073  ORF Transcript_105842/g.306073 Transcript_105842/m.306073 type:complete len:169 (-) Transcript_105842:104-610(-)
MRSSSTESFAEDTVTNPLGEENAAIAAAESLACVTTMRNSMDSDQIHRASREGRASESAGNEPGTRGEPGGTDGSGGGGTDEGAHAGRRVSQMNASKDFYRSTSLQPAKNQSRHRPGQGAGRSPLPRVNGSPKANVQGESKAEAHYSGSIQLHTEGGGGNDQNLAGSL